MLSIQNISFSYNNTPVLNQLSLDIIPGEHLSIIGASGCGKSTLLKLIYGLLTPSDGNLYWNEKKLLGPDFNIVPGEDDMKYLAQDFGLMPFITASENIGKYLSNFYPIKKKKRIFELLEMVGMAEYANVKAQFLSGGQQQRIALAQVLAQEPKVLLLDEPFSHIDNFQKNTLRRDLFHHLKSSKITCLVATHDATDALSFADNVLVLKDGKKIAYNTPKELYLNPGSTYTASLFGDVNTIDAQLFFPDRKGLSVDISTSIKSKRRQ